jgi:tetratricopeptide (TPR) repeat protein
MTDSKDPSMILADANQAAANGKFKTAVKKYSEYLKIVGPDTELLLKIAEVCEKADDGWRAIEYYEQASKLMPSNSLPLQAIARIYNSNLNLDKALKALDAALAISSNDKQTLLQMLYTLREIAVTKYGGLPPELAYERLIKAAETLIASDPQCCLAYCYRAFGRMRATPPDLAGARCDLDFALKVSPEESLALFFRALLHIEDVEFPAAFSFLDQAYTRFKKDGSKSYCDEIAGLYHHYKNKEAWAKRQRYRGMPMERQLEIFRECGIDTVKHLRPEEITNERLNREYFEIADPFHNLLNLLVGEGPDGSQQISNGVHFDTECINKKGDYAYFVAIFRDLANGAFPVTDICDHVTMGDDGQAERGNVWLSFTLDGKKIKWKPQYRDDWLDLNIIRKLGALVAKRTKDNRFILMQTGPNATDFLLFYLSLEQIHRLRDEIGLEFEML